MRIKWFKERPRSIWKVWSKSTFQVRKEYLEVNIYFTISELSNKLLEEKGVKISYEDIIELLVY